MKYEFIGQHASITCNACIVCRFRSEHKGISGTVHTILGYFKVDYIACIGRHRSTLGINNSWLIIVARKLNVGSNSKSIQFFIFRLASLNYVLVTYPFSIKWPLYQLVSHFIDPKHNILKAKIPSRSWWKSIFPWSRNQLKRTLHLCHYNSKKRLETEMCTLPNHVEQQPNLIRWCYNLILKFRFKLPSITI